MAAVKNPGCLMVAVLCGIAGFAALLFVFPNCEADSKQAQMARSLPPERLAGMHQAMRKLWEKIPEKERRTTGVHFGREQIPAEFGGLDAHMVRIRYGHSIVRLQGCMDHHLDLVFYGVGEPGDFGDHSPRIDLHSGEHNLAKQETIWRPGTVKQMESGK